MRVDLMTMVLGAWDAVRTSPASGRPIADFPGAPGQIAESSPLAGAPGARIVSRTPEPRESLPASGLLERVRNLYARLESDIAARSPRCTNRGACCKFEAYGHRLYVTAVELEYFLAHQRPAGLRDVTSGSCPYQIDGRCTARGHRPLGCRVFFCDPDSQDWQPQMYERYLSELKRIGMECGVEYRYMEWLADLRSAN